MHQCIHHSCSSSSLSTMQRPCNLQVQQHRPCTTHHRPRGHTTIVAAAAARAEPSTAAEANAGSSTSSSSSSTALQVRRLQQPQHIWGDMPAQQYDPTNSQQEPPRQASKPSKAAGFGGAKNSKNSGGSSSARQQQQQWVAAKLQDSCPCRSGLRYQVGPGRAIRTP
jgi:hypothetical protein